MPVPAETGVASAVLVIDRLAQFTTTDAVASAGAVPLVSVADAVLDTVPQLADEVVEVTCADEPTPGARLEAEYVRELPVRVQPAGVPSKTHVRVPGVLGKVSVTETPVAVPVPAALELATATVNPIPVPAETEVASAVLVSDNAGH